MSLMKSELMLASSVIKKAISTNKATVKTIAKAFRERELTNITTVARGTSDNAATFFKYVCEIISGIMVSKYTPSVTTIYKGSVNLKSNMLVAISQSGMSTDTQMVLENAKKQGSLTVAVTNNPDSKLAKTADFHLYLNAGEEKSVAATKTFTAAITVLYMLANELAAKPAMINFNQIPSVVEQFINDSTENIEDVALRQKDLKNIVVITRGLMQGVANELSLKILETCYTFTHPFSTSDFMHGPLALVEEGTNVIMLCPSGELSEEFIDMATRLSILGANIIAFTDIPDILSIANEKIKMPTVHSLMAPFVYTIAAQIFACAVAERQGRNPDAPRNLKKITITK